MGRLSVARIRSLSMPGLHGDGDTLYLSVARGGSKSWIQRLTIDGKRRDIGLGGWPTVSLAKARERAFDNRVAVSEGRDPLAAKRQARVPTFREAAQRTFEANRPRWRSAKVAANWMQQMERHAFGRLGDMPVNRIGREDVLSVLTPIWTSTPEAARKMRERLKTTLRWAMAHGYVEMNVAGEVINGALPSMAGPAALPCAPLSGGPRSAARHRGGPGLACRKILSALPDIDGSQKRRSARRNLGRNRPGCTGVVHPRQPHEGGSRTPRAAVRGRARRARPGAVSPGWIEPGLSLAGEGRATDVGRHPRQSTEDDRTGGPGDRSRVSFKLQGLGVRLHERRGRRHGTVPGALRRPSGQTGLCAVRPVRKAPGAHGSMGGLRRRNDARLVAKFNTFDSFH